MDSPADMYGEPINPLMQFAAENQESPLTSHASNMCGPRKSSAAGTQKRQSITLMPERRKSSSPISSIHH